MPHRRLKTNPNNQVAEDAEIDPLFSRMAPYEQDAMIHQLYNLLYRYVRQHLTPIRLAEKRRQAGDVTASPKDYHCQCRIAADALPLCRGVRPDCPFRHRADPNDGTCFDLGHRLARTLFHSFHDDLLAMDAAERSACLDKVFDWEEKHLKKTRNKNWDG